MTIEELNQLDEESFTEKVGPVFEESPWIAREAKRAHDSFSSREDLLLKLCDTVREAGRKLQVGLIRAHPDLAGRLAEAGQLTEDSTREQAAAGLTDASDEVRSKIRELNEQYREKFGFPFVICARLNKVDTILEAFEARLPNGREDEIDLALAEIFKIAELRLFDLVVPA